MFIKPAEQDKGKTMEIEKVLLSAQINSNGADQNKTLSAENHHSTEGHKGEVDKPVVDHSNEKKDAHPHIEEKNHAPHKAIEAHHGAEHHANHHH